MVNKTISLSEEIFFKLKDVDNASNLIDGLLRDHFKTNCNSLEEIDNKIKDIEEKKKDFLEKLNKEEKTLVTTKKEVEVKTEKIETIKKRNREKEAFMVDSIKNNFKEYMNREMSNDEIEEYFSRMEDEKGFNFFKFLEEKGYVYPVEDAE